MDKKKLTRVIPIIKKSINNILKFEHLGYIMKTYIFVSLIVGAIAFLVAIARLVPVVIGGARYATKAQAQTTDVDYSQYDFPSGNENPTTTDDFIYLYSQTGAGNTDNETEISPMDNEEYNFGSGSLSQPQEEFEKLKSEINKAKGGSAIILTMLSIVSTFAATYLGVVLLITGINVSQKKIEESKATLDKSFKFLFRIFGLKILKGLIIGIGFVLFVIPGIIFSLMFTFAEIVMVREDLGIFKALGRSTELTKGYKWQLFWRKFGIVLSIIGMGIAVLILGWQIIPLTAPLFGVGVIMIMNDYMEEIKSIKGAGIKPKTPKQPKQEA